MHLLNTSTELLLPYFKWTPACFDCNDIGVASISVIPDSHFTATTQYSNQYKPCYGRLHDTRGNGWCSSNYENQILRVDLGKIYDVCAVATQGNPSVSEWTSSFSLSTSLDNVTFTDYNENNALKVTGIPRLASL